ncbi:MAG TPA: Rieske (2Fe-2S) protein [Candidatus Acidoferrum sp.]|nr:Rieske (2Fe-2S) protein [Candidatus Acidoferrum sp.]
MATHAPHHDRSEADARIKICTFEDLERERRKVISVNGRTVLVLLEEGRVFAVDNRCPHMGFPLHRGTVKDGILTCHWHHAKFELAGGCTFDPFADDVTVFDVEMSGGDVWLRWGATEEDRRAHWMGKLTEGLEQDIRLVLAKSVIALTEQGATKDVLREAALFGIRNRARGWSTGLSILTGMANVLPSLDGEDRPLAIYHGLVHVARSTARQPPDFGLEPLATTETRPERYLDWFRRFIEVRAEEAAKRTLRTAIHIGLSPRAVADMIFAACTDHLFLDVGHSLDFANKAFELLDHIGWEHAEEILPSLVPNMVRAQRMEESSNWRHPVDLATLLWSVYEELPAALDEGGKRVGGWDGHQDLAERILDGEPEETLSTMLDLVRRGVPLGELSAAVAYAAARRTLHFHVSNEFGDWDTVHHSFSYANGVDQAMRRAPSRLLARGLFDGAMSIYLERFLNLPKQPLPTPSGRSPGREQLLGAFDVQGHVDETAQLVADVLRGGRHEEVVNTLGHALLREDAGFHEFQIYEAASGSTAGLPAGAWATTCSSEQRASLPPTLRRCGPSARPTTSPLASTEATRCTATTRPCPRLTSRREGSAWPAPCSMQT